MLVNLLITVMEIEVVKVEKTASAFASTVDFMLEGTDIVDLGLGTDKVTDRKFLPGLNTSTLL